MIYKLVWPRSNGIYSPTAANSWGDKIANRGGGADAIKCNSRYFEAADGAFIINCN
jgi:hypothetical protein